MGRSDSARRVRSRGSSGGGRSRGGERREKKSARGGRTAERADRSERRTAERVRQFARTIVKKDQEESAEAIREFKARVVACELCGEPIQDMSNAIANRKSGAPVHFDCVVAKLAETERLGQNDKITYIGQGKFAVLHFENIHDMRHFTIKREIEWEAREDERQEWRTEIAGLYSQVR